MKRTLLEALICGCVALLLLTSSMPFSLRKRSLSDTVVSIAEVEVIAQKTRPEPDAGIRVSEMPFSVIESNMTRSLSELISDNSLIYIKSMGQGALATSSFRGTSSGQTQVLWNGVSINSTTLGNFDFSQIPAFFTDEVSLFHGNGFQKSGTGALGGSVALNNRSCFNTPFSFKLMSEYGSNVTLSEGITLEQGNDRVAWRTRLLYQSSKNDYLYLNTQLAKDPFYERRKLADYFSYGAMQEVYWRPSKVTTLSANLWFMGGERSLPPPITSVVSKVERQKNADVRALFSVATSSLNYQLNSSLAYLYNGLDYTTRYSNETLSKIQTTRTHSLDWTGSASRQWGSYRGELSMRYRLDGVESDNLKRQWVTQNSFSLVQSNRWELRRWLVNGSVAVEANGVIVMPTFTVGGRYTMVDRWLSIKGSLGYNYRYPSLNDRYWLPGGNPDLRPERGFSGDATLFFTPPSEEVRFQLEATYFHMLIDDWIAWLPDNRFYYWTPRNIRKVESNGVEVQSSLAFEVGSTYHKLTLNYGYTASVSRVEDVGNNSTYGRQLPYVPRHKWNARYRFAWKGLSSSYGMAYTDRRFTTSDESYHTPSFLIHDVEAAYTFALFRRSELMLKLKINNLWNTYYESTQFYPMPLRSFYGVITFKW